MKILGIEFDIDITDAEVIERLEKGQQIVEKQSEELEEKRSNLTLAEGIKQECKIAKDFLDYVIGEGTSKELFGEKNSLAKCMEALEDLNNCIESQQKDFQNIINKYSPDRIKR